MREECRRERALRMGYRRPAAANLKLKTGARARRGDSARLQPRAGPNRASGQAAATEHRRTAAHRVDARVRTRTRAFEATSGAMSSAYAPIAGALDNGKSYNLERVLRSNIVYSDYYRQLCKVTDFMELVDEIYNEVDHCEPWMSGNARGPSTAFCNLFRLCTMELEDAQITHLIRHRDSPTSAPSDSSTSDTSSTTRRCPDGSSPTLRTTNPSPPPRAAARSPSVPSSATLSWTNTTSRPSSLESPEVTRRPWPRRYASWASPTSPRGAVDSAEVDAVATEADACRASRKPSPST